MTTAVLFVTNDAGIVPPALIQSATVTDSVEDALSLCASIGFRAVFCDAASLPNGGSGYRLGRQMRRNGFSTPLFLMTSSMLSSMDGVAAASGANGSISRTAEAILGALRSVATLADADTVVHAAPQGIDAVVERARVVLKKYAGPVAGMMIDDVLDELQGRSKGFTVEVFAEALASHVSKGKPRTDFLNELLN